MTFFLWSKTAASNSTADTTINWAEGQAPSTVNDSARAMMAAAAKFRDDISGTITTGGTSTAYTLTSNQGFTSLATMNGAMVTFIPHATNGAAPTLAVDGLAAKPIVTASGVAVSAGDLLINSVHTVVYVNANNEFRLIGSYDALMAPSGTIMLFQQTAAPTGWTKNTTHNDKALRVVTGTASFGGSVAFSTLFARTGTDPVTLVQNHIPIYTLPNTLQVLNAATGISVSAAATGITAAFGGSFQSSYGTGGIAGYQNAAGPTSVSVSDPTHAHNISDPTHGHTLGGSVTSGGGGGSFTPAIDCRVAFVDLILATKN